MFFIDEANVTQRSIMQTLRYDRMCKKRHYIPHMNVILNETYFMNKK